MANQIHTLLIHTDSYTGNTDNRLAAALFGVADDRYGSEQAYQMWLEKFPDEAMRDDLFMEVFETRSVDDYGMMWYEISCQNQNPDDDEYNTLKMFVDSYALGSLPDVVEAVRQAYQGNIVFKSTHLGGQDNVVKLLGFTLLTETIVEERIVL